jgi:hypothetical protein
MHSKIPHYKNNNLRRHIMAGKSSVKPEYAFTFGVVVAIAASLVVFGSIKSFSDKASKLEERCVSIEKQLQLTDAFAKERLQNLDRLVEEKIKALTKSTDKGDAHNKELQEKDAKHIREVMDLKLGNMQSKRFYREAEFSE